MTKLKQTYLSPETDLLVVRFEENIMSPGVGTSGAAGGIDEGEEYELG